MKTRLNELNQTTRDRGRNYISEHTGRQVYFRTSRDTDIKRKQGHFGCGPRGWACSYCGQLEFDCLCNKPTQVQLADQITKELFRQERDK
jgi:hypothetical protein